MLTDAVSSSMAGGTACLLNIVVGLVRELDLGCMRQLGEALRAPLPAFAAHLLTQHGCNVTQCTATTAWDLGAPPALPGTAKDQGRSSTAHMHGTLHAAGRAAVAAGE
jgi:hypothetical protein